MSDEEKLAEEFVIKDCCTDCPAKNQSCKEKCECIVFAKRAFLAGLKAGEAKAKKEIEAELLKCYQGYPEDKDDR